MRVNLSLGTSMPAGMEQLQGIGGVFLRMLWAALAALLRNFNGLQVSATFTEDDLASGVLTFEHKLGSVIVEVTIIQPNGLIRGDLCSDGLIAVVDENNVIIDLTGETVDDEPWAILVRRD